MRIVHIITRLIVGGAQENTLLSCEGQHDRGHEVTLISGPPIGPGMSVVRWIAHFVDSLICYIGWLFPLWDAKRQTFADKILNTIVIPSE